MAKSKLFVSALSKFLIGVMAVFALVFVPAGSIHWWNGWLFVSVLFIPMLIVGLLMFFKAPELLQKRLNAKEEEQEQITVVALSGLMFIAAFLVAGLGYRFDCFTLPGSLSCAGAISFLASYAMYGEVLRENAYLSRTIEIQADQHVISSGLYGIVRHPMYAATLIMFISIQIILGSGIAVIIMLAYIPLLMKRIKNEEEVLCKGLPGYEDYAKHVKWRLIPFLW